MMRSRVLLGLVLLFIASPASGAGASSVMGPPDSDAPPGAAANWLPSTQWVMERWVPFNESRLFQFLGLSEGQVSEYLYSYPAKSLDHLAREDGIAAGGTLARRVVGPRTHGMSISRWRLLQRRTALLLSQSHLSQHMLFHPFHITQISSRLGPILGVSPRTFTISYEKDEMPLARIALIGHRTEGSVRTAILRLSQTVGERGVRLGVMPEVEDQILQAQDRSDFPQFWGMHYAPAM